MFCFNLTTKIKISALFKIFVENKWIVAKDLWLN